MKTILTLLKILIMLLLGTVLNAQPVLQWQKNFGGSGNDTLWSIKTTREGGYIIAGQSSSNNGDVSGNHGGIDSWIVKLDAGGNITWQKSIGGMHTDIVKCIIQTYVGDFKTMGTSTSYEGDVTSHKLPGYTHYIYDDYGNEIGYEIIYSNPYPYPSNEQAWSVTLDSLGMVNSNGSGGYYVYGEGHNSPFSPVTTYSNIIIQTSDSGFLSDEIDDYFYNNQTAWPNTENFYGPAVALGSKPKFLNNFQTHLKALDISGIVETNSGYYLIGKSFDDWVFGTVLTKINFSGEVVWYKYIYGESDTTNYIEGRFFYPYSMQKTNDGCLIVAGSTIALDSTVGLEGTSNHGADDFWLMKLDSLGNKIWSRCYGGSGNDVAKSVQQMPDGSYMLAGTSYSTDGQVTGHTVNGTVHQADYWIVNVDSAGNFISGNCYGGTANDDVYSMEKTLDGGIIVAGTSLSTDAGFVNKGNADYWILKLNFCGTVPLPVACNQSFCSSCNPLVSSLKANGTNLKWYSTAKGGSALPAATKLVNGKYYVSQTNSSGCESDRKAIYVKVYLTPAVPYAPAIQVFHKKKSAIVANLIAYGTSLKWYNDSTGGNPLPLSAKLVTGCYYVSQTSSEGCESDRNKVSVIVRPHHSSSHSSGNEIDDEEDLTTSASVYPNPAHNTVTINIKTANTIDNADVQVMNADGKVLLQQIILNTKGLVQKTIDIGKLPDGFYILRYVIGKEIGSLKFHVTN